MSKEYRVLSKNISKIDSVIVNQPEIDYTISAATRGIDMLLAKYHGKPYKTEVSIKINEEAKAPKLLKPLKYAKIALITDGGLVPSGNPDGLVSSDANTFFKYPLKGISKLISSDYEVSHQGYDHSSVCEDPNRLVPVDAMRNLEYEGFYGSLYEYFYSTSGVMTPIEKAKQIGAGISSDLIKHNIDAAIITSTCGTSTRSGSVIAKQIENSGIAVIQITSLPRIAESNGVTRIIQGISISSLLGNSSFPDEEGFRTKVMKKALLLLQMDAPDHGSIIENYKDCI